VSFPFDLHSAAVFDSHMPCHEHAILRATSQGHGTVCHVHGMGMAWHGTCELERLFRDGMCATRLHSASSGYHMEFHEGCYQKHTNPLNCRTSSSDISGYHTDFHEGHSTVGEWQGHDMACVN
jgi:hypothetical protein